VMSSSRALGAIRPRNHDYAASDLLHITTGRIVRECKALRGCHLQFPFSRPLMLRCYLLAAYRCACSLTPLHNSQSNLR
jgi:hypothetical protein